MRVDEGRNCLESSHDENEDAYRSGVGGEEPAYCDPVSAFLGERGKKCEDNGRYERNEESECKYVRRRASQGKKFSEKECQTKRSTLKSSSLTSVKGKLFGSCRRSTGQSAVS